MAKLKTKWVEDNAINQDKFRSDNDSYIKGRNAADNADVNIIKVNASDALELASKLSDPDSSAPTADAQLANKKYVDDQVGAITIPPLFEVKGNWNASTNSPALDDTDTGVDNFLYYVSVAGTQDFGDGNITFAVGDWVYFNPGDDKWKKADNNDDVLSVNSQTGAVVLDADDISDAATTNKWATAAEKTKLGFISITQAVDLDAVESTANSATQPGDNISTLTNDSAFVDAAGAKAAAVSDVAYDESTWNAVTDVAPSKNAVRDEIEAIYTAIGAATGSSQGREVITLIAGDITNGYVELSQPALANSLHVAPVGGPPQEPGVDFTESIVVTNTRITFAGDLAANLASGDKLICNYEY